jgi:hypothetical protein
MDIFKGRSLDKLPTVLIGTPIIANKKYEDYNLEIYFQTLEKLTYPKKIFMLLLNGEEGDYYIKKYPHLNIKRMPTLNTALETVVLARNLMREALLNSNYDYLMFLEQDVLPSTDIIELLLRHDKTICSALYFNRLKKGITELKEHNIFDRKEFYSYPTIWDFNRAALEKNRYYEEVIPFDALFPGRLLQVNVCGLGAVLISKSVLKKISFRMDSSEYYFDEFYFGRDCHKEKIPIFVDTSVVCRHYKGI